MASLEEIPMVDEPEMIVEKKLDVNMMDVEVVEQEGHDQAE